MRFRVSNIRLLVILTALTFFQACGKSNGKDTTDPESIIVPIDGVDVITDFGDIILPLPAEKLLSAGYSYSDMLDVEILGKHYDIPMISDFSLLEAGRAAMVVKKGNNAQIGILIGLFASRCRIADYSISEKSELVWKSREGVSFPLNITISLKERRGYKDVYDVMSQSRIDKFVPGTQAEEQFCNFRDIGGSFGSGGGIAKGIVYRGASPIDNTYGRSDLCDKMMTKYKIRSVVNLTDTFEKATSYDKYQGSAYSGLNVSYCKFTNLETDISREAIAKAIRYIITSEPPIYVHCQEGKDRTGVFIALLEGFMGADGQEILDDDMMSFINYFHISKGTKVYDIMSSHIFTLLSMLSDQEVNVSSDIPAVCSAILSSLGLTEEELDALRLRLAGNEQS
ncbi:MAG: tyrosine-protein phosphatase [Bacteroidales bacterium]|nr:tyrosine-protein phosphatase [Bacteroidales bacterium]